MVELRDSQLFKQQAFINGQWQNSDRRNPVVNPANGEEIGSVPDLGKAETQLAIKAAETAFFVWRKKTAKERAELLKRWHALILENQEDLALLMTAEQGKPLAESRAEVAYGASFIEWFAEEGKRAYGEVVPPHLPGRRIMVTKEPVGVVAAITPWNFPNAMITRKAAPALAAGCTIVIKPAEDTPLSALALAELADRAGIPKGVFNIVTTARPSEVGSEMTANPIIRKLSFTGSTPVGKLLMKQCADTVKKMSMELGGNAPFIVFDDADIDSAVEGAIACKFRNAGQTCVCANRLFVQDGIYHAFVEKYAAEVSKLTVGPGLDGQYNQGPLINEAAAAKVKEHINDAVSKGGQVLTGGKPHALGGNFFEPTVIAEASTDMLCFRDEIFGPVAPVFRFKKESDVIAMANDTQYGLLLIFMPVIWAVSLGLLRRLNMAW